jgi:[FeFe] hydrogenase H-cluster maturation GTPase HydF
MMQTTPKSLRKQIGIFGRTNVGKSSLLNLIAGQEVAITSPLAGTTTDAVEKPMELLPIGPVVFIDTAGIDDTSVLAGARTERTRKIFGRIDAAILVIEPGVWTAWEEDLCRMARERSTPCLIVVNKTDLATPEPAFLAKLESQSPLVMSCSARDGDKRDTAVDRCKALLARAITDAVREPPLVADLVPAGGLAVLVVPIDLQAPRGRLILPQVQTIREAIDVDGAALVVKEREYAHALQMLKSPPDLAICDSQVVMKTVADTPRGVPCTTFSILFARQKGDLQEFARGAAAIGALQGGDKVLIAEACTHHAAQDDIGRVKIPRWLRQYTGVELSIDVCSGRDFPETLSAYRLVVHCGSCMLTRKETLTRMEETRAAETAITNYGVCIAALQGVIERVLGPFPAALAAYRDAKNNHRPRSIL